MKKLNLIWMLLLLWTLTGCKRPVTVETSLGTLRVDVVVAQDGTGDFTALQAAIDMAPDSSDARFVIYVRNGLYDAEKLLVNERKTGLVIVGEDREKTVISYHMYDCATSPVGRCPLESWELWKDEPMKVRTSATLTVQAADVHIENLTLQNTAGPVGQAQALTAMGDRLVVVNCVLASYQDTLYLWTAGQRAYFKDCLIIGRTDYIYGAYTALFEGCEIRSWGGGWVTAPATREEQPFGFVFDGCRFTYATGSPRPGDDGRTVAIGRPWHYYPKVTIIRSEMCAEMDSLGWPTIWNMPYAPTDTRLALYEYANTGAGADMSRRNDWAALRALTDAEAQHYNKQEILGGRDGWNPLP